MQYENGNFIRNQASLNRLVFLPLFPIINHEGGITRWNYATHPV